jgi:hypothetical protein
VHRQAIRIASSARHEPECADDEIDDCRSHCSVPSLMPTLDFVGAIERAVGYRDDAIF